MGLQGLGDIMINDGGAERMVRNRKITWYQIVVIIIMVLIVGMFGVLIYFTYNGEQLVHLIDQSALKDGYDLLKDVKDNFEDVAVYGYEQSEDQVMIEFRYYEEVLEKETDLIALSYEVKTFISEYLKAHPEDQINQKQKKLDLRFPDVHYSNFDDTAAFVYSTDLLYVTYEYSGITAGEFMNQVGKIKEAKTLIFKTDGEDTPFGQSVDFSGLRDIQGLERLRLDETQLTDEQRQELEMLCEELEIERIG